MKNKFKTIAKLGILLFGISLVITSCQKDDDLVGATKKTQTNPNIKIFTLNKEEIGKNKRLISKIGKLKTSIEAINNREIYNSEYDFTINTDYAKHIYDGINHSYTFPIYREVENGLIENLLLAEQEDNSFKVYIVQYALTESEITAINFRQDVDLESKVTFIEINDSELSSTVFGKYYHDGACYEDQNIYQSGKNCDSGKHTYSDGDDCDYWGTTKMASIGGYTTITSIVPCDGQGGDGSSPSTDISSGNPHGSGNPSSPTTTAVTCKDCPILDEDYECTEPLTGSLTALGLNNEEECFVINRPDLKGAMESFLLDNNTPEGEALLNQAIDDLKSYTDSDYPGMTNGYPFKWWEDENFIKNSGNFNMPSQVTGALEQLPNTIELVLFAIFPGQAIIHKMNADTAIAKTTFYIINGTFTPNSIEDGKADAFRHAYWNALDSSDMDNLITKIFTDAHEVFSSGLPKEMDLYNNGQGIIIGDNYGPFDNEAVIGVAILVAITNGDLKYINFNGNLVYTNQ